MDFETYEKNRKRFYLPDNDNVVRKFLLTAFRKKVFVCSEIFEGVYDKAFERGAQMLAEYNCNYVGLELLED